MLKSWILMLLCIILFINPSTPCCKSPQYDNDYKNDRTLPRLPCSTVCPDIFSGFEGTVAYSPEDRQVDEGNTEVTATFTCADASKVLEVSSRTCKNDGTGELKWDGPAPSCLPGPADCPEGFTAMKGFCYIFTTEKLRYASHKEACSAAGGYMAKIDDQHEQDIINEHLLTLTVTKLYIGLEDTVGNNENYRWIKDNTVPTYTNWLTAQPDADDETCVAIGGGDPIPGAWGDLKCTSRSGGLCEADP